MPNKKQIPSDDEAYLNKNEYVFPNGLETGPILKRSSTDLIFILIFIICFIGFCGCAGYVFIVGDPKVLGKTYDTDGQICGKASGYEDYPYLYYPIPTENKMTRSICVKTCPTAPLSTTLDCKTNSLYTSCVGTSNDPTVIATAISTGVYPSGAVYIYETATFYNRLCLPLKSGTTYDSLNDVVFGTDLAEQWAGDITKTYVVIIISLAAAIGLGILYVWGMRYSSGIVFFSTMFLSLVVLVVIGIVFIEGISTTESQMDKITDEIPSGSIIAKGISARRAIACIFWVVCGLIYTVLICVVNKLKLMPKLMASVSEYVKAIPTVFMVSLIGALVSIGFSAYWLVVDIYTVAIGDFSSIITTVPYGTSKIYSGLQFYVLWYLAIFFWVHGFINGCVQYIIASSAATWYCSQGTGNPTTKTISTAAKTLFRYHLGSIAFGSLFITFFEFTRILLSLLRTTPKSRKTVKGEKISRFSCRCFDTCIGFLESIVVLINKNAYIQIALTGKDFGQSACYALELNKMSPLVMKLLGNIGSLFTFYGKIFIASASSLIGLIIWTYLGSFTTETYSPIMSVLLIFFFSYAVGSIFVTVYGTAADTFIACFVIEEELNKTKYVPSQYGTKGFRLFMLRTRRVNMQIQI